MPRCARRSSAARSRSASAPVRPIFAAPASPSDSAMPAPAASDPAIPAPPPGRFRWAICALLFFVITINYVDRQVIGVLKPVIETDMGWSEVDYGNIVTAFQASYGDRKSTRLNSSH